MIAFERFTPEHLDRLNLQPAQSELRPMFGIPGYAQAIQGPHTWTALIDGRVVGMAGVQEKWSGRGLAWAMLSEDLTARDFLAAHNFARRGLETSGYRRLETAVSVGFAKGHRWVRALGFEQEGLMKKFTPEGRDAILYARVQ